MSNLRNDATEKSAEYNSPQLNDVETEKVLNYIRTHYEVDESSFFSINRPIDKELLKTSYEEFIEDSYEMAFKSDPFIKDTFTEEVTDTFDFEVFKRDDINQIADEISSKLNLDQIAIDEFLSNNQSVIVSYNESISLVYDELKEEGFIHEANVKARERVIIDEDMEFMSTFEQAAALYELGQHQLSEEGVTAVKNYLSTLDNVQEEKGQFIITREPYLNEVDAWMKDNFDEYSKTHFKPEEMLSKEQFLDYMKDQEMGGFRFEKVASLATHVSKQLQLDEAEVLTYLADSSDIQIHENYRLEEVYDQEMAAINPVTKLSYVEEKAINMYLYVNKGLEQYDEFELEHDVTNPTLQEIVSKIDFSTQSDEYIQETLSYSDEFMEYIEDCYKNQVTNEVAEALNLDKEAVYGHFLSSYECNDGLEQVENMIINQREENKVLGQNHSNLKQNESSLEKELTKKNKVQIEFETNKTTKGLER